jgi:Uma2 family endonuclease
MVQSQYVNLGFQRYGHPGRHHDTSAMSRASHLDQPQPAWEIAHLFPPQGAWSEEEYLALSSNRLVEYSSGSIEVLPMPTMEHQLIVAFLYSKFLTFLEPRQLGRVLFAPFRLRLWPGKFREPDLMVLLTRNAQRMRNEYWEGADLVVEVVSNDDRRRDVETKRDEYARAGISEYWIVDPRDAKVLILSLEGNRYRVAGEHAPGEAASSVLLGGLEIAVAEIFAASSK